MGYSVPWQDAMEAMTGQRDILATPLLNYFEPLRVWLEAENAKNGDMIGWEMSTGSTAIAVRPPLNVLTAVSLTTLIAFLRAYLD